MYTPPKWHASNSPPPPQQDTFPLTPIIIFMLGRPNALSDSKFITILTVKQRSAKRAEKQTTMGSQFARPVDHAAITERAV